MQSVWNAGRRDGMAPIERALVLGIFMLIVGGSTLLFDTTAEGEPQHWYELLSSIVAISATGLISDMPLWVRVPIGAGLLIIDSNLFEMAFNRPDAFDHAKIATEAVSLIAFATALPLLDPPGWLRRWSRVQQWRWLIYYLVNVFVLVAAVVLPALVYGVFSGKIDLASTMEDTGPVMIFLLPLAVVALFVFVLILLQSNWRNTFYSRGAKTPVLFLRPFLTLPDPDTLNELSHQIGQRFPIIALDRIAPVPRRSPHKAVRTVFLWAAVGTLGLMALILPRDASYGDVACKTGDVLCEAVQSEPTEKLLQTQQHSNGSFPWQLIVVPLLILWKLQNAFSFPSARTVSVKTDKGLARALKVIQSVSASPIMRSEVGTAIIRTSDAFWQEAAQRIGEKCQIAIIDLSQDADSLTWEIAYLKNAKLGRIVIMLDQTAALPASVADLNALVVRYRASPDKDKELGGRLRDALSQMAEREMAMAVESGTMHTAHC